MARLRKLRDEKKNGRDPALWREMAAMGWAGILVPEEYGGAGLGYVGLGVVLEEAGRTLGGVAAAFERAGGRKRADAGGIGRAEGGVAAQDRLRRNRRHSCGRRRRSPRARAEQTEGHEGAAGCQLSGEKRFVADGHIADLFIVAGADGLFLVKSDAAGLESWTS